MKTTLNILLIFLFTTTIAVAQKAKAGLINKTEVKEKDDKSAIKWMSFDEKDGPGQENMLWHYMALIHP
jgi:hypothetical protein